MCCAMQQGSPSSLPHTPEGMEEETQRGEEGEQEEKGEDERKEDEVLEQEQEQEEG